MLNYHFPPLGGMGSIRAQAFARLLPEFGWTPLVVTPRQGDHTVDPSLSWSEERVLRTHTFELSRTGRALADTVAGGQAERPATWRATLSSVARRYIYRPDAHVGWAPFALASAWRALRRERFDAVFSSALPVTAHLVALRLHQLTGLPWVAEFRDLWTDFAEYEGATPRAYRERMERRWLRAASAVVATSPTWARVFAERGAREVAVITNGFEPAEMPRRAPEPDLVAYLGTFYPGLQDLPTAIAAAAALRGDRRARLRFRIIGEGTPALREAIAQSGLGEAVEVTGNLPQRVALERAAEAAVLVLAGPTSSEPLTRGHIPGKVFEYLGLGRPILYCGALDSDVAGILGQAAHARLVGTGDIRGACRALDDLLGEGASAPADVAAFTRRAQCERLARLLDQVTCSPRQGQSAPSGLQGPFNRR